MTAAPRDPRVVELLQGRSPAQVTDVVWARPLRLSAYVGEAPVPDELVVSVRCLVVVGTGVVVCTNVSGSTHAWPGGHREPGESYVETACREVHEETGWVVEPTSISVIGFLHLFNQGEPLEPYPYPDAFHIVVRGRAARRAAAEWTDVEGYEVSSEVLPLAQAIDAVTAVEPMCVPFLHLL